MSIITYREAIRLALNEEMQRDERVFLIGEDIGRFGGAVAVTKGLYERFGEKRLVDTPISESAIIGCALGAALTGLIPIAELMFIDFAGVCMDQIANQAAKVRYMLGGQVEVPLTIRTHCGAGKSYAAQHSQNLEPWFCHIPGIKVVMPSTPKDARGLLKSSVRDPNPVFFIEHSSLYNLKGEVSEEEEFIPLGKADIKREGKDVTVVTYSRQVHNALEAADKLYRDEGIDCEVIDLMTVSPIDEKTVFESIEKTGRLVTVEECYENCGVGAEIITRTVTKKFEYLDNKPIRISFPNCPIPFSPVLENSLMPGTDKIIKAVMQLV